MRSCDLYFISIYLLLDFLFGVYLNANFEIKTRCINQRL